MVLPRKIEREDSASIYIDLDDIVHMNHMNDLLLKFINFQLDLNLRDFDEMRELQKRNARNAKIYWPRTLLL